MTQPQGHSTSGSHERYKTPERLEWEREWDCIRKFKEWIIDHSLAEEHQLDDIENAAKEFVRESRHNAWEAYLIPIKKQIERTAELSENIMKALPGKSEVIRKLVANLSSNREPNRRDVMHTLHEMLIHAGNNEAAFWAKDYYDELMKENRSLYNSHLYNEGPKSTLKVPEVKAVYNESSALLNGYEVLNRYFDELFGNNPRVIAFGEDLGFIGDVNQGFAGLQAKHGAGRIFDTGIRELTIMGQGIGLALRGLRPIAEIQYLDYLIYGLQPLTDDLATMQYRTVGKQSAPMIVRTRGHRLEGIWHSGSPMGMIIGSLRGCAQEYDAGSRNVQYSPSRDGPRFDHRMSEWLPPERKAAFKFARVHRSSRHSRSDQGRK